MSPKTHSLICSVKNEGPYIIEFIAHHRVLGFDHIHFCSNNCSDGTDNLLDILAGHGLITHTHNVLSDGEEPQQTGYNKIWHQHSVDKSDWAMVLDVDEFLHVAVGDGTVQDLTSRANPDIDLIILSSLNFGTVPDPSWKPGLVTHQFTRRIQAQSRGNAPAKSLFRGKGRFSYPGIHCPEGFKGGSVIRGINGRGETMNVSATVPLFAQINFLQPRWISHEIGWYAHYPIKSRQSYKLRQHRGLGTTPSGKAGTIRHSDEYWNSYAIGKIEDRRIIETYGPKLHHELNKIAALPGVVHAHRRCVSSWRDQLLNT